MEQNNKKVYAIAMLACQVIVSGANTILCYAILSLYLLELNPPKTLETLERTHPSALLEAADQKGSSVPLLPKNLR